jgi:hypothetical protein
MTFNRIKEFAFMNGQAFDHKIGVEYAIFMMDGWLHEVLPKRLAGGDEVMTGIYEEAIYGAEIVIVSTKSTAADLRFHLGLKKN